MCPVEANVVSASTGTPPLLVSLMLFVSSRRSQCLKVRLVVFDHAASLEEALARHAEHGTGAWWLYNSPLCSFRELAPETALINSHLSSMFLLRWNRR